MWGLDLFIIRMCSDYGEEDQDEKKIDSDIGGSYTLVFIRLRNAKPDAGCKPGQ